ncbi:WUSCHEL-related homeobox 5-like [Triticum urartu]|uniref:WUSCHEL-related homeobox 5-like n=1 Tax=Triticum urartu TaxID=4572 RepID=UPI0020438721|nr:WUSCHEL-related homeobox 5-like [Triticum urartu]
MESVDHHDKAATRLSLSPPHPPAPLSLTPSPNSAALVNVHWVPTREQLAVLEGLYRQGMRIPTAEEIHQVMARLQEHGPIEGKNVFHWFQNQQVRLRQREKRQRSDYFARQFRRPHPLPVLHSPSGHPISPVQLQAPPAPNTPTCNGEAMYMQQPCYMSGPAAQPAANATYYSQMQPPIMYPSAEMMGHGNVHAQAHAAMYYQAASPNNSNTQQMCVLQLPPAAGSYDTPDAYSHSPVLLNLFPQYPTFANRKKTRRVGSVGSARPSTSRSISWETESPKIPNRHIVVNL